jgi:hypothetical protein
MKFNKLEEAWRFVVAYLSIRGLNLSSPLTLSNTGVFEQPCVYIAMLTTIDIRTIREHLETLAAVSGNPGYRHYGYRSELLKLECGDLSTRSAF